MILFLARERVQYNVVPLAESARVHWREHPRIQLGVQTDLDSRLLQNQDVPCRVKTYFLCTDSKFPKPIIQ